MMIVVMLFILNAMEVDTKVLCLSACPAQIKMLKLKHCDNQCKIAGLPYKKRLTVWELGKNKFT
jgi:hypothetical protein